MSKLPRDRDNVIQSFAVNKRLKPGIVSNAFLVVGHWEIICNDATICCERDEYLVFASQYDAVSDGPHPA